MDDLMFRCSGYGHIMGRGADSPGLTKKQIETVAKYQKKESLTDKQGEELDRLIAKRDYKPEFDLSVGAKTHVRNKVRGIVFGTKKVLKNKYLSKGTTVEDDSIELYNEVHFTKYAKNLDSNKKKNKWIQGTCDIDTGKMIIDIKSSWSLETFPVLPDEIEVGVYEWQLRGYMMLYDRDYAELAYCMVDTPDCLLDYEENLTIHHVSHIEPELRVTKLCFDRCQEKEDLIKYKVTEARKYANWYANEISKKYG